MACANNLNGGYVVDGLTLQAGLRLIHPKRDDLLKDLASGRAKFCSHTYEEAKSTGINISQFVNNKIEESADCWKLTNNYLAQLDFPFYVQGPLVEPKVLIIASAFCESLAIVTDDEDGPYCLASICDKLAIHHFPLSHI